jgi:hypothetical protein
VSAAHRTLRTPTLIPATLVLAAAGCRSGGVELTSGEPKVGAHDTASSSGGLARTLAPDTEHPQHPDTLTREELMGILDERDAAAESEGGVFASVPVDVSGGIFLWHYQPFLDGVDPSTSIYWAWLTFDADLPGDVDFHLQTMFRDSKLRPFFESNVWIQEAYLDWQPKGSNGALKVGKLYSRFGRFWDGTFYGNVPYFDGLKLDPDLGLSYERVDNLRDDLSLEWTAQYFPQDGGTNGSLQGRDTLSLPGALQRNSFVTRIAPTLSFSDDASLTLGLSGMVFEADFAGTASDDVVTRWAAEASLSYRDLTVFGEFAHQNGTHAPDYPVAGANESDISWIMSGIDYTLGDRWQLGYRFSLGDYADTDVREVFHMPRLQYQVSDAVSLWLEYVTWDQEDALSGELDDSLNIVLYAAF